MSHILTSRYRELETEFNNRQTRGENADDVVMQMLELLAPVSLLPEPAEQRTVH